MLRDQPNRPPPPWLPFRRRLDLLKRQLPPDVDCEIVFEQPPIVVISDDEDDPVIVYESIAPKVIKASEKEVKKFINSYEESIRGIDKQTMIMQKYNDDFDFCMRHTTPENLKQLKGERGAFITMMDQIAEAQASLLEDSNCIMEDSSKMRDQLRIKIAQEQEFYRKISACVPNNIPNIPNTSKPQIPERTKELEEGIAQSDLKTRFTHLHKEETFRHNKWTTVSAEHALKSPEELRRRLDEQASVLEEEEHEERKLEDTVIAIMDEFQKVELQFVVVKQQLEEQQKVQSELDEIEKSVKRVQDLIREQFNTVQNQCPICYLEFTNGVNSERCPQVWQNQKMMLVFGKVENVDLTDGTVKSEKNCIDECFNETNCVVAYMNLDGNCLSFNYNYDKKLTVTETTRSEGLKVAIKTIFSLTECPSYDQLEMSVSENEESISWRRTSNGWTFMRCIDDWTMFTRSDTSVVCMQTFSISKGVTRNESIQFCEEMGIGFKLTGVASADETQWINFEWTDGYTTVSSALSSSNAALSGWDYYGKIRENCLSAARIDESSQTINDVSCDDAENQFGAVCGYQLI
ncbi:hypothetical protein B9Z55_007019 [Caenorhabditis nigoni]|uniref:PAN-3 domain-containing protein n=1 Tax=Caenorhabditis nigoni TaxID=1611254 RepID=A0A2G5V7W2_9PELO|nr:hypothetical protein B9Z55_007019 [Caenorhabditis nigoni]